MNYNNQNQMNLIGNTLNNNIINDKLLKNNLTNDYDGQQNIFNTISNDNLMRMANSIDPLALNGTSLDDIPLSKMYQKNKDSDNTSLIKSLTKEIINNLKENNMSLYDNSSINSSANSRNKKINIVNDDYGDYNNYDNYDNYGNDIDNDNDNDNDNNNNNDNLSNKIESSLNSTNSANSAKKNKKKKKEIFNAKESIENFIANSSDLGLSSNSNSTKHSTFYVQWFFENCFNCKDFLILFILYFILSQEMIKDFFAKYFNCLNPDEEGKIGVQGVIIYGLILATLFIIFKKMF